MNKQGRGGIGWTKVWGRKGYTWNPVSGCLHECAWEMPDGALAECYAKAVAEGLARRSYPDGFYSHYWHPDRLIEPFNLKEPAGIFLDSMSDLMRRGVPEYQIDGVLEAVRVAHWHTFFLLTKNAPRLLKFDLPPNVWVGVSAPPTFMHGKRLTGDQQQRMLRRSLLVLRQLEPVRWLSLEPLSFDVAPLLNDCPVEWFVIGAASAGRKTYQPKPEWVQSVLDVADAQGIRVFMKDSLDCEKWERRREFPPELIGQMELWAEMPTGGGDA